MAITKTTKLQRCEVYPAEDSTAESSSNLAWPSITAIYMDTIDDESDADLPVTLTRAKSLFKWSDNTDTIISGEDPLVQDLCGAAWDL